MEMFLKVGGRHNEPGAEGIDFDELGVAEVVELLDNANMEAVVRDFGDRNPREDPVIHFYELFLKEYDAEKRMQRGVFYTPRPIVSYIVRSVHTLLQSEFGAEGWPRGHRDVGGDGRTPRGPEHPRRHLAGSGFRADPRSRHWHWHLPRGGHRLHPQDACRQVAGTRARRGQKIDAFWNEYVPTHLLPRLHGYELLMAPYAIAHLKIGLKLYETGYRFGSDERARVYLTNALESEQDFSQGAFDFAIPALADEARAVNEVKRAARFTVVVGNPPYSKISSNLSPEMRATVERYRYLDGNRIRERGALQFEINLQDDYVKFFRFCEQQVFTSNLGVLGLITNNGYLSTPTLRGMRDSLLETFDSMWILDLHGHLAKGETGPDGTPEANVFDIVQGVSLFLGERTTSKTNDGSVFHSNRYGSRISKYSFLQDNVRTSTSFFEIDPTAPFYLFVPHDADLAHEWRQHVGLTQIFPKNSAGIVTARDALVIAEDKHDLADRIERFSKAGGEENSVYEEFGFSKSKRFDLRRAQSDLQELDSFIGPIRRLLHRPFDERFIFFHKSVVWSLSRPMADQMANGNNLGLIATRQVTRPQFEHVYVSRHMIEIKACSHDRNTQMFPLFIRGSQDGLALQSRAKANIDPLFFEKLAGSLKLKMNVSTMRLGQNRELTPLRIFQFVYAVLHSFAYRKRYFEFLRSDFPRIPLVSNLDLFLALGKLGGELVALHLLESPQSSKFITKWVGSGRLDVEKVTYSDGGVWIDKGRTQGFRGVPEGVWQFRIGGYQVCHKWLKDRRGDVLSRDDIDHYQKIVTVLANTIRLMEEIDDVIERHGGWPDAFQSDKSERRK